MVKRKSAESSKSIKTRTAKNHDESILSNLTTKSKKKLKNINFNLFNLLKNVNYNIDETAHAFLNILHSNPAHAHLIIIGLFLDHSNSKLKFNNFVNNIDNVFNIESENFYPKPYLLGLNSRESKIFKFNLEKFIFALFFNNRIIIFEHEFFREFSDFLKKFAGSSLRAFRHLSTYICLILLNLISKIHYDLNSIAHSTNPGISLRISKKNVNDSNLSVNLGISPRISGKDDNDDSLAVNLSVNDRISRRIKNKNVKDKSLAVNRGIRTRISQRISGKDEDEDDPDEEENNPAVNPGISEEISKRIKSKRILRKQKKVAAIIDSSLTKIKNQVNFCEEFISEIFNDVFSIRYRDILPEIRLLCISSLFDLISANPDFFLKNDYLKYFGWLLNDKNFSVRVKTINCIYELINDLEFSKISTFISRFKIRILDMGFDISDEVCATAVKIAYSLYSKNVNIPQDKFDKIISLVFSSNIKISRNSAMILLEYTREENELDHFRRLLEFGFDRLSENCQKAVDFQNDENEENIENGEKEENVEDVKIIENELNEENLPNNEENIQHFVNSLFNISEMFSPNKFLELFQELLSQDISEEFEYFLIKFASIYIKVYFKKYFKSKISIIKKTELIEFFIISIIKWMSRFRLESDKLLVVLEMAQCISDFDVNYSEFNDKFNEKFYEIFLLIFLNSNNEKVLTACSLLLEKIQKAKNLKDMVPTIIAEILNSQLSKIDKDCQDSINACIIRMACLIRFINLSLDQCQPFTDIIIDLKSNYSSIVNGAIFVFLSMCWHFEDMINTVTIEKLLQKYLSFISHYISLKNQSSKLFQILCDTALLISKIPKIFDVYRLDMESIMDIHLRNIIMHIENPSDEENTSSSENITVIDFDNDFLSFAKVVHYCEISENLSLFLFEFSKKADPNFRHIYQSILLDMMKKDCFKFFDSYFSFLKSTIINEKEESFISTVSEIVSRISQLSIIKKDQGEGFINFLKQSINFAIDSKGKILKHVIYFKRILPTFSPIINKIIDQISDSENIENISELKKVMNHKEINSGKKSSKYNFENDKNIKKDEDVKEAVEDEKIAKESPVPTVLSSSRMVDKSMEPCSVSSIHRPTELDKENDDSKENMPPENIKKRHRNDLKRKIVEKSRFLEKRKKQIN